ncbi:YbjN domain-containing protein [Isoptericola sp. NEAU-Y5]|uniref:YbjN domain-containing protein n=1 Tax=Isoptericola luteus TaxID=2879484 RepID=A0ABS7ZDS5_9MICO|nr:YbjN domain-containing protein [Isoptericola sp. NEAU-Y5]MCA5893183.1 YbjN domain-containing protein [Isoptericola sp. NEAU-Y5]
MTRDSTPGAPGDRGSRVTAARALRTAGGAVGRAVQHLGSRAARRRSARLHGVPVRPRPLTTGRLADDLERRGYRFRTDADGDVTGTWDGNRFWFLMLGDHSEILQVRGRWAGTVPTQARLSVLQAVNDWNRERVWPKVYTRAEGEALALYAEVSVDFEHGATDEQVAATVSCGLVTASQFFATVGALVPPSAEDHDGES